MIVSGRVSRKMAPVLRRIYDQMPEPKWVISMGACATSGGVFDNYAIVQGVDKIVPVDIYVPGCPPRPEMLVHAITMLQDKIMKESVKDRRDTFEPESRISRVPGHAAGDRRHGSRTRDGSIAVEHEVAYSAVFGAVEAREAKEFVVEMLTACQARTIRDTLASTALAYSGLVLNCFMTEKLHAYVEKLKEKNAAWVADVDRRAMAK